jgi:hypothetical protein
VFCAIVVFCAFVERCFVCVGDLGDRLDMNTLQRSDM